jgi:S1-C subfamily serine protease
VPPKIRAVVSLLIVGALTSGCATVQTRDRLDEAETRISVLEDELAAITSSTTAEPASSTSTIGVSGEAEPIAAIAARVSPAVVQIETRDAVGSGVIYTPDGLVLTAAHVVEGFPEVTIRLNDGRTTTGTVLGTHHLTDVAVVRIDGFTDLPVAEFALGEELQTGQLAVAVGSPFGFSRSVTAGIVSTTDRIIDTVVMVQTDAAINPGNSGGPLVDADGRVIGISDIIFTDSGESAGVGFAIRIDLAALVAEQIVAGEDVRLAFLGVLASADPEGQPGAVIHDVTADSAAEAAGIQAGDRITAVDGHQIYDADGLRARILVRRPGDVVSVTAVRDGQDIEFTATLGSTTG